MIFIRFVRQFDFEYDIQGIIRSFYPNEELKSIREDIGDAGKNENKENAQKMNTIVNHYAEVTFVLECDFDDVNMSLALIELETELEKTGTDVMKSKETELNETELKENRFAGRSFKKLYENNEYSRKLTKNKLKRELYTIMHHYTKKDLCWGTLSGIRPTKITSALLEMGMSEQDTYEHMRKEYYLSDIKAHESIEISKRELDILKKINYKAGYSLYIGIPFCPSTCLYCSFTSNPVGIFKDKMEDYLDALLKELEFCAEQFQEKKLCTIYIGGGTPTSISAAQLDRLLMKISELYDTKGLYEFTIEAGRPDSITSDKLKVIRNYDITRISINPQTMKDETLKIIGRHHTVGQFLNAYDMARAEGFDNINMDFILGLPGEDIDDVRNSMEWVSGLKPDSLTIHSLAIKRAARLNLEKRAGREFDINNSEEMMQLTRNTAMRLGLNPYYLYRQKNMAGNLENVGYAKEGKEGIYNILIMEEKQTILAVGAGSSSKMVDHELDKIDRIENVKDVGLYIDKIDEMIERKRKYLNTFQL